MKRFLSLIAIILFFSSTVVFAQGNAPPQGNTAGATLCPSVDKDSYKTCCVDSAGTNVDACFNYCDAASGDPQCTPGYRYPVKPTNGSTSCSTVDSSNYSQCCLTGSGTSACNDYCDRYPDVSGCSVMSAGSGSGSGATAGYGGLCGTVGNQNYRTCCIDTSNGGNACNEYCNNSSDAQCTEGIPGVSTGSGQGTQPINGKTPTTTTNAVAAGSQAVQKCNAIKFVSLLDYLIWAKCIIGAAVIPMIFTAAFLFFLWGVMRFIMATDLAKKEEGKKFIYWGLVGLFVMVSVWGIIKIVGDTLGVKSAVPFLQTEYLKKP